MGIHKEIREYYTCDVCGTECAKPKQSHSMPKNRYMDMSPSAVKISIRYLEPMEPEGFLGLVCNRCQVEYLRKLADEIESIGIEFVMQS